MGLTSWALLGTLAVLEVAAVVGMLIGWDHWPRRVRWLGRTGLLLLTMVLAVTLTADVFNRNYGFYSSWADLLNSPVDVRLSAAATQRHQQLPVTEADAGAAAADQGHGSIVPWTFPGPKSGITRQGLVYLPAAYFQDRSLRFPVLELFHGYSGSPENWTHALNIRSVLDTEISAGRLPPVIAVIPKTYQGNDGECVDAVGGQRNETYLAVDIPADVGRAFRTATAPGSWATVGFSTGGFCAANLALHHPNLYRAAVSLSGYFTAETDRTTGNLYRGEAAVTEENSPRWWVRHRPVKTALYVFASGGDHDAIREAERFRKVAPPGLDLTTITTQVGGHNATVWNAALPPALDWLGQRLPDASAPPLVQRGAVSRPAAS
jgi:S-formylglutathione hydrolase FrmB